MSARRWVAAAFVLLSTVGFTCGPRAPPLPETEHRCADLEPPDDGLPAVSAGIGEGESFAAPSGPLIREHGPQGGTHVTLTLRLFADQGESWQYDLSLLRGEEVVGAGGLSVTACPGSWVESTYVRLFLYDDGPIDGTLHVEAKPIAASEAATVQEIAVTIE